MSRAQRTAFVAVALIIVIASFALGGLRLL
jgi:hypothetical protein